jgi:hypothetical protein
MLAAPALPELARGAGERDGSLAVVRDVAAARDSQDASALRASACDAGGRIVDGATWRAGTPGHASSIGGDR